MRLSQHISVGIFMHHYSRALFVVVRIAQQWNQAPPEKLYTSKLAKMAASTIRLQLSAPILYIVAELEPKTW